MRAYSVLSLYLWPWLVPASNGSLVSHRAQVFHWYIRTCNRKDQRCLQCILTFPTVSSTSLQWDKSRPTHRKSHRGRQSKAASEPTSIGAKGDLSHVSDPTLHQQILSIHSDSSIQKRYEYGLSCGNKWAIETFLNVYWTSGRAMITFKCRMIIYPTIAVRIILKPNL